MAQASLFELSVPPPRGLPDGLVYEAGFLASDEEAALITLISNLPLAEAKYKQYTARRRVLSFGWSFDFETNTLKPTRETIEPLHALRDRAARWANLQPTALVQTLLTEYNPGAPLGRHRDVPDFGDVIGISLGSTAELRFRPYPHVPRSRLPAVVLPAQPRSIYLMRGPARWEWQHSCSCQWRVRHFRAHEANCSWWMVTDQSASECVPGDNRPMTPDEKADPTCDQEAAENTESTLDQTPSQARSDARYDAAAFTNRLRKNLAHWHKWARRRGITCFRIYGRDVPQFPFAIDWFETISPRAETHLHVQEIDTGWKRSDADYTAWLTAVCDSICEVCGVPAAQLHLKRRERQRGTSQYEKLDSEAAEVFVVEETGLRFEVNFDAYLDTGLFLDHRPMRAMVAESLAARAKHGAGKRFLNLFAYTGSFTVHAARAGSDHSTTVDLSNTYQAWTARNFALNGIDASRHQLVRADALAWMDSAAARRERFDVIVLDPPSFSNSKKMLGVLDVQRDHMNLVSRCHALLADGGELFFSTNLHSFKIDAQLVQQCALREITRKSVPEDFRRPSGASPHRAWHAERRGR